ncbi:MAG TPA: hypothetical protein VM221_01885 [Armatimonadota bacterium]|nr:hypothetical protein [Armatimonadota bacterium]
MRTKLAVAVMTGLVVLMALSALQAQMMHQMLTEKQQVAALDKAIAAGKQVYSDPKLGTNRATCNSCHPNGGTTGGKVQAMGMDVPIPTLKGSAATFPKWKMGAGRVITLGEMNNGCITMFLKGKALEPKDPRYAQLAAYVTSLSKGKPVYPQLPR